MESFFNIKNKLYIFKNVISEDFAKSLINHSNNKLNNDIQTINHSNHIEIICVDDKLRYIVNNEILKYIKLIYKDDLDTINAHESAFLIYKENHYMSIHQDGGAIENPRICTSVLYLNDRPETALGGELICYDGDYNNNEIIYTYSPKIGDLIIFDSFYNKDEKALLHSVNTIHDWERFTYRTYWQTN
jgi:Rps23 Pro-64 3,4-dihydroxylase Tpa1-like proline 4-hydroxylase